MPNRTRRAALRRSLARKLHVPLSAVVPCPSDAYRARGAHGQACLRDLTLSSAGPAPDPCARRQRVQLDRLKRREFMTLRGSVLAVGGARGCLAGSPQARYGRVRCVIATIHGRRQWAPATTALGPRAPGYSAFWPTPTTTTFRSRPSVPSRMP